MQLFEDLPVHDMWKAEGEEARDYANLMPGPANHCPHQLGEGCMWEGGKGTPLLGVWGVGGCCNGDRNANAPLYIGAFLHLALLAGTCSPIMSSTNLGSSLIDGVFWSSYFWKAVNTKYITQEVLGAPWAPTFSWRPLGSAWLRLSCLWHSDLVTHVRVIW